MPRKNKRKFFFGKNKKSKSAKLENQNVTTELEDQKQSDSDEEESNASKAKEETGGNLQKSAVHASISSVTNDSTSEVDANSLYSLAEIGTSKTGTVNSSRWRSEPILNMSEKENRRQATIMLKIIQFTPKINVNEGGGVNNADTQKFIDNKKCDENKSIVAIVNEEEIVEQVQPSFELHVERDFAVGEVPKLNHFKEGKKRRQFDDSYQVESPNLHSNEENRNKRRHGMLIQEISESSSSEEVKQFLDAEASALELKSKVASVPIVESPESSSDEFNKNSKQSSLVQEICESSSNESVKNEILASMSKQPTPPSPTSTSFHGIDPSKAVTLKIINIQEFSSNNNNNNNHPTQILNSKNPTSPIMKHKPAEKKLNKAEEAIMEALYGNPNLLQIPNTPLDAISEEGSDCSDIERHSKINQLDIDDDEVFLPPSSITENAESPSKFKHRRRVISNTPPLTPPVEQPTMLINAKIIETESNVPESCNTWNTTSSDNELQAELVYLPSTSSSATDLSERSGEITDPEDTPGVDTSEDTETNSLLDNISVPSLHENYSQEMESINFMQPPPHELYIDSEQNQLPLPDIVEESEDLSQKSLELI